MTKKGVFNSFSLYHAAFKIVNINQIPSQSTASGGENYAQQMIFLVLGKKEIFV